jgi:hypothetical protein
LTVVLVVGSRRGRLEREADLSITNHMRTLDLGLKRQNENTFCNMLLTVTCNKEQSSGTRYRGHFTSGATATQTSSIPLLRTMKK